MMRIVGIFGCFGVGFFGLVIVGGSGLLWCLCGVGYLGFVVVGRNPGVWLGLGLLGSSVVLVCVGSVI
jgi:hypothetical protein